MRSIFTEWLPSQNVSRIVRSCVSRSDTKLSMTTCLPVWCCRQIYIWFSARGLVFKWPILFCCPKPMCECETVQPLQRKLQRRVAATALSVQSPMRDVGLWVGESKWYLKNIEERKVQVEHVLTLSYGKDSCACLGAIAQLGLPIDRIVHAEVWATNDIPADPPPDGSF